jgi:hypothetical protein
VSQTGEPKGATLKGCVEGGCLYKNIANLTAGVAVVYYSHHVIPIGRLTQQGPARSCREMQ